MKEMMMKMIRMAMMTMKTKGRRKRTMEQIRKLQNQIRTLMRKILILKNPVRMERQVKIQTETRDLPSFELTQHLSITHSLIMSIVDEIHYFSLAIVFLTQIEIHKKLQESKHFKKISSFLPKKIIFKLKTSICDPINPQRYI